MEIQTLKLDLGSAVRLIHGFRTRRSTGLGRGPPRAGPSGWQRGRRVVFTCSRYFLRELIRLWEGKCSVPGECRGPQNDTMCNTLPPRFQAPPPTYKQVTFLPHSWPALFKIFLERERCSYSYIFLKFFSKIFAEIDQHLQKSECKTTQSYISGCLRCPAESSRRFVSV